MKTSILGIITAVLALGPLTVLGQPTVNPNFPTDQTVSLNGVARFTASVSGANSIQWWFKDAPIDPTVNPTATKNALVLSNVTEAMAGSYWVVATNDAGSATSRVAQLIIDPTFVKITNGPIVEDKENSVIWPAWGDFDGDGRPDLFIANNYPPPLRNSLYHNLGNDQFVRATNNLTTSASQSWAGLWADYDNDGDQDLFVVHPLTLANELFRNDGAFVFTRVASEATSLQRYHTGAAWVDLDRDGFLDLFVTTDNGQVDYCYRGHGDGTFTAWQKSDVGPIVSTGASTYGPAFCDLDHDGRMELYVPRIDGSNFLFDDTNNGQLAPVHAGSLPAVVATASALWADLNNDGLFDLVTTTYGTRQPSVLHLNQGGGQFIDTTAKAGLSFSADSWGATAGDYDNDGDLDLYLTDYSATHDVLYQNHGDATFVAVNVGSPLTEGVNDGAIWVDYDNDGWLDLFKACGDVAPAVNLLYRNHLPSAGNQNHWLKIKLEGTVSNRSAIGTRIEARTTNRDRAILQVRQVLSGGQPTCTPPGLPVHFGLGDATQVDLLRIEWPSGIVQELRDVAVNQLLTVTEPPRLEVVEPGKIRVRCWKGMRAETEVSNDLASWSSLGEATNETGTLEVTDPEAANCPCRFYRARMR